MADPLSVTASIIAVVTAAECVSKAVMKIVRAHNAPCELLALVNEVSDLRIILNDLESYLIRNADRPQPSELLGHIAKFLQRAKDQLLEIDQLIQYKLVKSSSTLTNLKVSRYKWIKAENAIERHRQGLRDTRMNIIAQMTALSAYATRISYSRLYASGLYMYDVEHQVTRYRNSQARIGLVIDQILDVTNQLRTSLLHANRLQAQERTAQQVNDHFRLLADIIVRHPELRRTVQSRSQQADQTLKGSHINQLSSRSVIGIQALVLKDRRFRCLHHCTCTCHTPHHLKSPNILNHALGSLFVGYTGFPGGTHKRCSHSSCLGQQGLKISVMYLFPVWFLYGTIRASVMSESLNEISSSLRFTRHVSPNAEVFRLTFLGDTNGLQRLFSQGKASPNDICAQIGLTPLTVAVNRNQLETCKFLLKAGADARLDTGRTSPHTRAWNQIYEKSLDQTTLATLRTLFPADDDEIEERQFSVLHKIVLGVMLKRLATALLCDNAYDQINVGDSDGTTPLMWAARRGDSVAVDLLLRNNADPNICNRYLQSALLNAVRSKCFRCAKLLLDAGADPTQKDRQQFNVLHYAALYCNDREVVQCLIDAGAEIDGRDSLGETPLFYVTHKDNVISARAFLTNGADVNAISHDGDSTLYKSLHSHAHHTFRLLLEYGASYTSTNSLGEPMLHSAAKVGNVELLEIMHAAGLKGIDPDATDREGKTPMQRAQEREDAPEGFVDQFQQLITDIRIRIASQSRQTGDASGENTGRSADGNQSTATSSLTLPASLTHPLQKPPWIRSLTLPTWKSILIYWLLGLGWAGFAYKLLEPTPKTQRGQHSFESMGI